MSTCMCSFEYFISEAAHLAKLIMEGEGHQGNDLRATELPEFCMSG